MRTCSRVHVLAAPVCPSSIIVCLGRRECQIGLEQTKKTYLFLIFLLFCFSLVPLFHFHHTVQYEQHTVLHRLLSFSSGHILLRERIEGHNYSLIYPAEEGVRWRERDRRSRGNHCISYALQTRGGDKATYDKTTLKHLRMRPSSWKALPYYTF